MIAPPPGQHRHQMSAQGPGHSTQARQGCHQGEQTRARRKAHGGGINGGSFPITDYMYGSLFRFLLVRLKSTV
jgi:hypothetical protein